MPLIAAPISDSLGEFESPISVAKAEKIFGWVVRTHEAPAVAWDFLRYLTINGKKRK